jgi:hypothetical protein
MSEPTIMDDRLSRSLGAVTETGARWAELHRRALEDVADLSVSTLREGTRLVAELGQTSLETWRETLAMTRRWQASTPDLVFEPMRWYQGALIESVEAVRRAIAVAGMGTRLVLASLERVQAAADLASRRVQEGLAGNTSSKAGERRAA